MDKIDHLSSFLTERLMSVAGEILEVFKEAVCEYQRELERITEENRCLRKALSETETDQNRAEQRAGCPISDTVGVVDSEPSVIQVKLELATLKKKCEPQPSLNNSYTCTSDLTKSARGPEPAGNFIEKTLNLEENKDSGLHIDHSGQYVDHSLHIASVKPEPLESQASSSGETSLGEALNELVNHPTGNEQGPLPCSHCDETFSDVSHLTSHLRDHEVLFSCEVCGKFFEKKGTLKTHMTVHQKERPFRCKVCGKSYSCASALNVHLIIHSGERPFGCGYCEKRFKLKSHLKEHERTHTGEKPFSCPVCRKCFSRSNAVKIHIRNHHSEQFQLSLDQ